MAAASAPQPPAGARPPRLPSQAPSRCPPRCPPPLPTWRPRQPTCNSGLTPPAATRQAAAAQSATAH
eukprot:scaffold4862_cov61-Phaeocystis_antarctica.AAC.2